MIGALLKNYLNLKNPRPNTSKMYIKFNNLFFPIKNLKPQNHLKIIKKRDIAKKYFYKSKYHSGLILYKTKKYSIIECEHCKYVHAYPFPKKKELTKFYEKKYYHKRKNNYFSTQKSQLDWWNKIYLSRLKMFEKVIGKKGSILEIGCGPGFFLNEAKKRGWKVTGIDPSPKAIKFVKKNFKIKAFNTNYENIDNYLDSKFDLIYNHGVIEHISDANLFFKKIKKLLKRGGLFFSSSANEFNEYQLKYLMKNENDNPSKLNVKPWFLVPPEHLNYFNHNSIKNLYLKNNFKIINQNSSFPIDVFLKNGIDYIKNPLSGNHLQNFRQDFEKNLILNFDYENFFKFYKINFFDRKVGRQTETLGLLK